MFECICMNMVVLNSKLFTEYLRTDINQPKNNFSARQTLELAHSWFENQVPSLGMSRVCPDGVLHIFLILSYFI